MMLARIEPDQPNNDRRSVRNGDSAKSRPDYIVRMMLMKTAPFRRNEPAPEPDTPQLCLCITTVLTLKLGCMT